MRNRVIRLGEAEWERIGNEKTGQTVPEGKQGTQSLAASGLASD